MVELEQRLSTMKGAQKPMGQPFWMAIASESKKEEDVLVFLRHAILCMGMCGVPITAAEAKKTLVGKDNRPKSIKSNEILCQVRKLLHDKLTKEEHEKCVGFINDFQDAMVCCAMEKHKITIVHEAHSQRLKHVIFETVGISIGDHWDAYSDVALHAHVDPTVASNSSQPSSTMHLAKSAIRFLNVWASATAFNISTGNMYKASALFNSTALQTTCSSVILSVFSSLTGRAIEHCPI